MNFQALIGHPKNRKSEDSSPSPKKVGLSGLIC